MLPICPTCQRPVAPDDVTYHVTARPVTLRYRVIHPIAVQMHRWIRLHRWSMRQVADLIGVGQRFLSQILSGELVLGSNVMRGFAARLGMPSCFASELDANQPSDDAPDPFLA